MRRTIHFIFVLAMMLLFFVGCSETRNEPDQPSMQPTGEITDSLRDMTVEQRHQWQLKEIYEGYFSGDYGCYQADSGLFKEEILPDEESAKAVAQQVFDLIKDKYDLGECEPSHVLYYEELNAWIVGFSVIQEEGKIVLDKGCSIVLNKTDGRVMRIF